MNIFVLSSRALISSVCWDPVFELENIVVRTCNAQLLVPSAREAIQWSSTLYPLARRIVRQAVKSTTGLYNLPLLPQLSDKPNVLLRICIAGDELNYSQVYLSGGSVLMLSSLIFSILGNRQFIQIMSII